MSSTACRARQNELINIVAFLGLSVGGKLEADKFLSAETLGILAAGMVAFSIGTAAGVSWADVPRHRGQVNPLIGSAGVSAVRVRACRTRSTRGQPANSC